MQWVLQQIVGISICLQSMLLLLTFLNCMTKFIRLLVENCAWLAVVAVDDCNKSSIEILFLIAWYNILCRRVNGQYTKISIWKEEQNIFTQADYILWTNSTDYFFFYYGKILITGVQVLGWTYLAPLILQFSFILSILVYSTTHL